MNLQTLPNSGNNVVPANDNFGVLDAAAVFGKDATTTAGLTRGWLGGNYAGTAISAATTALTNAATNYGVAHRATGAVSWATNTTNWDNTLAYGRIAKVTTAGNVITADEDWRFFPGGIFAPAQPHIDTTAVGNVGTGEDNLISYTLVASLLNTAKKGVKITAWGTYANNADAKTLKLYFGSLAILTTSLTANQAGVWRIEAEVISTGTDAQDYVAQLLQGGTTTLIDVEQGSHTQDDGAAITVKCTGEATSNDDIKQEGLIVQYFG